MKKLLFLITLLIVSSSDSISAQNGGGKPVIILTPFPGTSSDPTGQQNSTPVIEAEYDSQELTLSVTNYAGDADILILKTLGHNVMYDDTDYISETNPVSIDISSYPSGTYTLMIELDPGNTYIGEFIIE